MPTENRSQIQWPVFCPQKLSYKVCTHAGHKGLLRFSIFVVCFKPYSGHVRVSPCWLTSGRCVPTLYYSIKTGRGYEPLDRCACTSCVSRRTTSKNILTNIFDLLSNIGAPGFFNADKMKLEENILASKLDFHSRLKWDYIINLPLWRCLALAHSIWVWRTDLSIRAARLAFPLAW